MTIRLSNLARGLIGSEILKIAAEVRELMAQGRPVCNLTVGDFSPKEFRIPERLARSTVDYIQHGETNYPPSPGVPELRKAVVEFYRRWLGLEYDTSNVIVTSGGRPVIYGAYMTVVNEGERVVYPVPSWNNNHYARIVGANAVEVPCDASTDFLPTAAMLREAVRGATLLALNSPSNPTGTLFSEKMLAEICDLVLEENARRGANNRPLYLL
ncbi:MAG TPA: aminotransferase class I/II-fold pyridoxal phosphate-dependent enzyme, partial [Gemmatimonadaceae bacterium]|nr:aminotransferase class I/II-fold pyridoxal phosphate-dependent enzyme [Gemmatimonadaceae bacterium]